ncbi:glycosyltransferase family 2 protein [Arcobacteraceae bacterium]|nr:glycosyltransferase family 2 protein [Arcobacteraceae bacterium]
MLIENISVVIMAKDAESTIEKCLSSLIGFKEVVLYLNDTTDNTKNIASKFNNVNIIDGDFIGFGPTKNKASSYSKNDWVFSLDSDEVVSEIFIENIKKINLTESSVYTILRTNFYKNTQIKHCWGDDVIVRLYNKTQTSFTNKKVHEHIISNNFNIEQIEGIVEHYPYSTVTDFIVKLDRYSTIYANDNVGKKNSSPLKAILNAKFSFFKTYFLKRGFLDGYAGLIIAFSHMATNFYKYIKLYELNKELKSK